MRIRAGRVDERLALEALQRRAFLAHEDHRRQFLDNPDSIELPRAHLADGLVRVAEADERVLGFSTVLMGAPRLFVLDALFVEPRHWRQGIGRALIGDVCRAAAARGGGRLQTVANPPAEGFYERLGFRALDSTVTLVGPARRMVLEIPGYPSSARR
jgi:predicted N-acetyltransferase YhbS